MPTSPIRPVIVISPAEKLLLDAFLEKGETNLQLAERLHKTEDTIKTQMKSLMRKCGVSTRTELVVAIMRDRVRLGVGRQHVPPARPREVPTPRETALMLGEVQ